MSLLLAALMLQPTVETRLPADTVSIPDGVAPSVTPYLECLRAKNGERLSGPVGDPDLLDAARDAAIADCRDVRIAVAKQADDVLRTQGHKADSRRQTIESVLRGFEDFFGGDALRRVIAQGPGAAAPPGTTYAVPVQVSGPQRIGQGRLEIPDEIAPAIVPYLNCLAASRGIAVRGSNAGTTGIIVGSDCSSQRLLAAKQSDMLLKRSTRKTRKQRLAMIEATLEAADRFLKTTAPAGARQEP
jgi:hypothetical protein